MLNIAEPAILYEDNDLLILNKPAGLAVHSDQRSTGPFLTDWLLRVQPNLQAVGEDPTRPGIVHRLDKDTSGVLVVAKTASAYHYLKSAFQTGLVVKQYLVIVIGRFKGGPGTVGEINHPIGRSRQDPRRRVASAKAFGRLRAACTRYRVLAEASDFSLLLAEPVSGRTHQLRAHFKALQHPVAGDALYGPAGRAPAGLKRQALHAWKLDLPLPGGCRRQFTAPPPADLAAALASFDFAC